MTRSPLMFAAAAAIGLLAASPAVAQTEVSKGSLVRQPGPAIVPKSDERSRDDIARDVTFEFGRCVVWRHPGKAEAIAAKSLSPGEVDAVMRTLATPDCLSNATLKMPPGLMRGAIFRGLYLRDFGKSQPLLLDRPFDFTPMSGVPGTPPSNFFLANMAFADCVVRGQPMLSRALTMSRPGTPGEDEAVAQIRPHLGGCLFADTKVTFNRAGLSALIAEALYRESRAAAPPTQKSASR